MSELQETSVLIVEPDVERQRIYRQNLIHDPTIRLLGICSSARSALAMLDRIKCDILFAEIDLAGESGVSLMEQAVKKYPGLPIIIVSYNRTQSTVLECFAHGAMGYVLKTEPLSQNLGNIIRTYLNGGSSVSPPIARILIENFEMVEKRIFDPIGKFCFTPEENPLSPRETEILQLLAKGMSFAEIAEVLSISGHTVTAHIKKIYRKLQVHSRGEAVYEAALMGILRDT